MLSISGTFTLKTSVDTAGSVTAADFLSAKTGLSKSRIKDAMNKGAVWIQRKGRKERLRKATASLKAGDHLEIYYDQNLLALLPPEALLLHDLQHYSVWYKPAGLMAQGTLFGDHCSLLRQVELFYKMSRPVFLVHRLDREASGLMLIAHTKQAAARLSALFRDNRIFKGYRLEVRGDLSRWQKKGSITIELDGKSSVTDFVFVSHNPDSDISAVEAVLKTGRLHQIRRHFAMAGFPVMGDPRYGEDNKNSEGLRLAAVSLQFLCPFLNKMADYRIPEKLLPF